MTCSIPIGWFYAGTGHTHISLIDAEKDIKYLQKIFPNQKFDTMLDDRGGQGYERYIIITNKDPIFGDHAHLPLRKRKKIKPNFKRCKCKK